MDNSTQGYFFNEDGFISLGGGMWSQTATPAQVNEMRKHLRNGLELGGLGIGVLLDYMTEAVTESAQYDLRDSGRVRHTGVRAGSTRHARRSNGTR